MNKQHEYCTRSTKDLIPYVNNSRTHSAEQVKQVASSIKEFGFTNPVLIDENNGVVAGHGRLMAADMLSLDEVPCIILKGLTEAQKKAYVIADNQLALNSGWDLEKLQVEIDGLKELDFDIDLLGFGDDLLDDLNEFDSEEDEEVIPEEQNYHEKFNIIIECMGEAEQEQIYQELTAEGYKCQVQSL